MSKIARHAYLIVLYLVCVIGITPQQAFAQDIPLKVYLGGYPICMEMYSDGPIVTEVNESLAGKEGVKVGDVIKSINDYVVESRSDVYSYLQNEAVSYPLNMTVLRNDRLQKINIVPPRDVCSGKAVLGFSMKDGLSGIGTMTCYTDDGIFYALGHSVRDVDSTSAFDCRDGKIYDCVLCGNCLPKKNVPGKLIGKSSGEATGYISANARFGLSGRMLSEKKGTYYETANRTVIRPGKATLVTTINNEPEFFDIEIIKTSLQCTPSEKGMVIRIVDEKLISATKGILQGMSGSPILQNGRLVGALTHVFTNDSIYGYGVYIDWILGE